MTINLNIVIPVGGRGSRFQKAGYDVPKPLLPISGNPMLECVLYNILCDIRRNPAYNLKLHLISSSVLQPYEDQVISILKTQLPNSMFRIHYDNPNEEFRGPAYAVLHIINDLGADDSLVIINSDQYIKQLGWFESSLLHFLYTKADGGLLTFIKNNGDPKWSYADIENDIITRVVEKEAISHFASVGMYYFKRVSDFEHATKELIARNLTVNNEFYVGPAYNILIEEGKKVVPFFINNMLGLGTPEDYLANKDQIWK